HPVFASGSAGAGVAVIPDPDKEIGEVQSPVAGTIVRMQPHMFVAELEGQSARVLVQRGMDTDQLDGQGVETAWGAGSAGGGGTLNRAGANPGGHLRAQRGRPRRLRPDRAGVGASPRAGGDRVSRRAERPVRRARRAV